METHLKANLEVTDDYFILLYNSLIEEWFLSGPHQFPPLLSIPTSAMHQSYLPPSPAPMPQAGGTFTPGSSVPGGSALSPSGSPTGSAPAFASQFSHGIYSTLFLSFLLFH